MRRLAGAVRARLRTILGRLPRPRLDRWTLLWLLALMPLLVGPPIAAAIYGGAALGAPNWRERFNRSERVRLAAILVLAIANALLSLYTWSALAESLWPAFLDLLQGWLGWPGPSGPDSRIIPI